jgi:hypothetical protein
MVFSMEPASNEDVISSIAPNVMRCLGRCGLFEKLDGLLSPEDNSVTAKGCDGMYKLSESILIAAGFERSDLDDVFAVLNRAV